LYSHRAIDLNRGKQSRHGRRDPQNQTDVELARLLVLFVLSIFARVFGIGNHRHIGSRRRLFGIEPMGRKTKNAFGVRARIGHDEHVETLAQLRSQGVL
jgi:hypothetical protein